MTCRATESQILAKFIIMKNFSILRFSASVGAICLRIEYAETSQHFD